MSYRPAVRFLYRCLDTAQTVQGWDHLPFAMTMES